MSEMLDKMMAGAERGIRERIGTKDVMLPIWHVMHADGQSEVIGTPWGNYNEKEAVFAAMRAMFRTTDVIAYSIVTEAWTTPKALSQDEVKAMAPDGDIAQIHPSVMPDRVEVFTATASDGSTVQMKMWDIRRDRRGRVQAIVQRPEMEGGEFGGSIATMLKE